MNWYKVGHKKGLSISWYRVQVSFCHVLWTCTLSKFLIQKQYQVLNTYLMNFGTFLQKKWCRQRGKEINSWLLIKDCLCDQHSNTKRHFWYAKWAFPGQGHSPLKQWPMNYSQRTKNAAIMKSIYEIIQHNKI